MEAPYTKREMLVWTTIFLAAATTLLLVFLNRNARRRLPPGPPGWPLVGNIFDLGRLPHATLAGMKQKYGPVIWIRLGLVNTLVINSADAAAELFKSHDQVLCNRHLNESLRSDEILTSTVALSDYGPYWRMMRRLYTTEMFAKRRIQNAASVRRKCVDKMIQWISDEAKGNSVEVLPFLLATSFNLIGNIVLSRDLVDPKSTKGNDFFDINSDLAKLIIKPNVANFFPFLRWLDPQGMKNKVKYKLGLILEIVSGFVEERRRMNALDQHNEEKDLLDVLLEFEGNGKDEPDKISDRNLNMLILELLTAGTETSVTTVEWAMTELLCKPEVMKKVRAEIDQVVGKERKIEESDLENMEYLAAVIKETLRLHPGPFLIPRTVPKDMEFMGYSIPKNTQIFINAWGLARDPSNWEDPLTFKPERFLGSNVDFRGQSFEFLPFGSGRRMCPGFPMALQMLHLMLGSLIQSFDWVLGDGVTPETIDMEEKLGTSLRKAIPLKAIPKLKTVSM